jgi:hypothetical protein
MMKYSRRYAESVNPFFAEIRETNMSDAAEQNVPHHKDLPLPDYDHLPVGTPATHQSAQVPGPPINPPSHGTPTNPAQPR